MNKKTKLFVLFIFLIYLFLFIFSFKGVKSPSIFLTLLFSGIIFEIITIAIADFSGSSIKLTGGIIVNILASSLLSPAETMLIASTSVLIPRLYKIKNLPPIKFIFNASQIGLSAFVASVLFRTSSTGDPLWNIPVIFLIAFVYMS
ncbi:MAG: phosphohydrolase, partial [Thermotoga sp.]